jgi:single-stranded-DNA-specific exonuclease
VSSHKILNIGTSHSHPRDVLAKELGISKILAQVLINRGIKTVPEAHNFIHAKLENLLDPGSFRDMPSAVRRLRQALEKREKVMVCGDYDVDGITALSVLKRALDKIGLEVTHYLPHRVKEGYGLNKNIIEAARQKKIKLLLTVDCGTSNHAQIKELKRHNIDTIITDHHQPLNCDLPPAHSIINPKVKGEPYPYRDLAGVGVAYKLAQAITGEPLFDELDLVCVGTIADVVPLTGENRIIAKEGLRRLARTRREGLKALIEVSGIKGKPINATFVSFILAPRLNASGRLDSAESSLRLLLSDDAAEAMDLARVIDTHNRQRQKVEGKILEEAEAIISKEVNFKEHNVIVIAKEDWHPGVLGIVASKIADRFYRPAVVISLTDNLCKGSARSIKNFHLFEALCGCRHLLEAFGGHAHAAGLVIPRKSIAEFKESINRLAKEKLTLGDLLPSLDIDLEVGLADLDEGCIGELEALEPFGTGNPEPLFYTRGLRLKGEPQLLGRNTLKFWVTDGETTYQAIGFGMGELRDNFGQAASFGMVYTPRIDTWQGEGSVLLEAKDLFFK